jgi:glycosyltransferase involved in cell wall biosynthesis
LYQGRAKLCEGYCLRQIHHSDSHKASAFANRGARKTLTLVIPFHNEVPNFAALIEAIDTYAAAALRNWTVSIDVIFVDDGSTDGGVEELCAVIEKRHGGPAVRVLRLSRNFGKEVALAAGLDLVSADAVVMLDADLQHPLATVDAFIDGWLNEGYEVVYGVASHDEEPALKRGARKLLHRAMNANGEISITRDAGDFRLLSRRAYEALRRLGERQRMMKGLYNWIGFRQKAVPFTPLKRHAGKPKFSPLKLWMMTLDGITSNTLLPLRLAAIVGVLAAFLTGGYGLWTIFEKLVLGIPTPGYPTIVVIVGFVGSVQLIFLGVIGEYLGRVLVEVRGRPLYLVETDITLRSPDRRMAS